MKMKHPATLIVVAAIVGSVVAACGNDHPAAQMSNTPPPPPSMPSSTQVNTGEFLTGYANATSETDTPIEVDGGVLTFTDASDTAAPVAIN